VPHTAIRVAACFVLLVSSSILAQQVHQETAQQDVEYNRQAFARMLQDRGSESSEANRRATEYALEQFRVKFNAVATEMNRLKDELEAKGTFNAKQAHIVRQAWRKLFSDPGWIEKDKDKF